MRECGHPLTELTNGQLRDWIHEVRRDLTERVQHEEALAEARVWDLQISLVDHCITGENQIEIEGPRRTLVGPRSASRRLDRAQAFKDLANRPVRLPHADGIQVRRIVFKTRTHRRGFDE